RPRGDGDGERAHLARDRGGVRGRRVGCGTRCGPRPSRGQASLMRVLVQRVSKARVVISGDVVGAIEKGLLLLVGITATDTEAELQWMAAKCANLRIFADD